MFEGMTGVQKFQVWQWLIFGASICFVIHCVRRALQDFWTFRHSFRRNETDCGGLNEIAQKPGNVGESGENGKFPPKSTESAKSAGFEQNHAASRSPDADQPLPGRNG